jgi:hypothetical protein
MCSNSWEHKWSLFWLLKIYKFIILNHHFVIRWFEWFLKGFIASNTFLPYPSCLLVLTGSQLCHSRPTLPSKPDFKPIVVLLHFFIIFSSFLVCSKLDLHLIDFRNWSIIFIQSIKCFGIEFEQLDFGPDLRVRGLTNLKLLKINQALKQSFVTMKKVFEVSISSIIVRIAWFYFSIGNFFFIFLPNRFTISWVFRLFMFSSSCSF